MADPKGVIEIPGIYVPQIHHPPGPWYGGTRSGKPSTLVKRRWVEALSPEFYPTKPVVPVIDIIQDRVSVEVMRGCTQGCRFCQAGYWYRPTRELNVDDVVRSDLGDPEKYGKSRDWLAFPLHVRLQPDWVSHEGDGKEVLQR